MHPQIRNELIDLPENRSSANHEIALSLRNETLEAQYGGDILSSEEHALDLIEDQSDDEASAQHANHDKDETNSLQQPREAHLSVNLRGLGPARCSMHFQLLISHCVEAGPS